MISGLVPGRGCPTTPLPRQPPHPSPVPAAGAKGPANTTVPSPGAPRAVGFPPENTALGGTLRGCLQITVSDGLQPKATIPPCLPRRDELPPPPPAPAEGREHGGETPTAAGGHTRDGAALGPSDPRSSSVPFSPRGRPMPRGRAERGAGRERGGVRGWDRPGTSEGDRDPPREPGRETGDRGPARPRPPRG